MLEDLEQSQTTKAFAAQIIDDQTILNTRSNRRTLREEGTDSFHLDREGQTVAIRSQTDPLETYLKSTVGFVTSQAVIRTYIQATK